MTQVAEISSKEVREKILGFESALGEVEGAVFGDAFPLKHSFSPGIYVREIFIPADTILTGKIHKHAHPNFLMEGEVEVFTEAGGMETLVAPVSMISKSGTKRVVKTLTNTRWITVHHNPNNLTDVSKLEELIIAKDYTEYEKFIRHIERGSVFNRIFSFIKHNLKLNK